MSQTAVKTQKQVQVLVRAEFKANGIVVYRVRSSNGIDTYEVTFFGGKATHCDCKAWQYNRTCCHATQLATKEQARIALEHKIDADIEEHLADEQFPKKLSREEYIREFSIY